MDKQVERYYFKGKCLYYTVTHTGDNGYKLEQRFDGADNFLYWEKTWKGDHLHSYDGKPSYVIYDKGSKEIDYIEYDTDGRPSKTPKLNRIERRSDGSYHKWVAR